MYTLDHLQHEVAAKIQGLKDANAGIIHPDSVAAAIVADHPDFNGKDAEFYRCCTMKEVRKWARRELERATP